MEPMLALNNLANLRSDMGIESQRFDCYDAMANQSFATDGTYFNSSPHVTPWSTANPVTRTFSMPPYVPDVVESMLTRPYVEPVEPPACYPPTKNSFSNVTLPKADAAEDDAFPSDGSESNSDRQRRKEKKRRNAVLYRARKRQQTEQLQSQLTASQARVECLEAQLQVLRDENTKLMRLLQDAHKLLGEQHKVEGGNNKVEDVACNEPEDLFNKVEASQQQ